MNIALQPNSKIRISFSKLLDEFALFHEPLLLGENRQRFGIGLAVQHDHQVLLYMLMREHIERVLRRFDNNYYRSVLRDSSTDSLQSVKYVISESMELQPSLGLPVVFQASDSIAVQFFPWREAVLERRLLVAMEELAKPSTSDEQVLLVCTADVRGISETAWDAIQSMCLSHAKVSVFILEDSYGDLRREVRNRLARASTTLRAGPGIVDD